MILCKLESLRLKHKRLETFHVTCNGSRKVSPFKLNYVENEPLHDIQMF